MVSHPIARSKAMEKYGRIISKSCINKTLARFPLHKSVGPTKAAPMVQSSIQSVPFDGDSSIESGIKIPAATAVILISRPSIAVANCCGLSRFGTGHDATCSGVGSAMVAIERSRR
jgi:hypothetical protein